MKSTLSLIAPLFAGLGACAIVEKITTLPRGWQETNQAVDPSQVIKLSIALRQPQIDSLQSKVGYGKKFLTQEQVEALRAPSPEDVTSVMNWLSQNGIDNATPESDWIHIQTTVAKAEPLLKMKLHQYVFGSQKATSLRTTEYSVPDSLKDVVNFVHPVANFMTPERNIKLSPNNKKPISFSNPSPSASNPCAGEVNPACIKKLYNITYAPTGTSPVTIGVAGFLDQYANFNDLASFLKQTKAPSHNFTVETVNGGVNSQTRGAAGSEADLDIQYVVGVGAPVNTVFYATGGRGEEIDDDGNTVPSSDSTNEPYLDLLTYLLNKTDSELPAVLTISYGDDELSVPRAYADKVCGLFGMLTGRGVTILSSSGDGGAVGSQDGGDCMTNDGSNKQITMATFPAVCEWITTVGGISNQANPPVAAYFSSGGFSYWYPRPSWQNSTLIENYITALDGHLDGKYNASNRAFPDVAMLATSFDVVVGGGSTQLDGTSASAPTFAALIGLINDARVRQGKTTLGFINELLYSENVRAVLEDVTSGSSTACNWDDDSPGGWLAVKGWDAVTGLGVPSDFSKFFNLLVAA